jgi:hypothetical protein
MAFFQCFLGLYRPSRRRHMPRKVHKSNLSGLCVAVILSKEQGRPRGRPCLASYFFQMLAVRGFSAEIRKGRPQILVRVYRGVADADLIVKM